MVTDISETLLAELSAIRVALERLAPPAPVSPDWSAADTFVWQDENDQLLPISRVNRVALNLIQAVGPQAGLLLENTSRFAGGLAANNVLLWGARGMGKSSLVKAVHHEVSSALGLPLKLVGIHREDIEALPRLMAIMRNAPEHRFIVFCDDLSFDGTDTSYKSLKAALEGGVEGRPRNVLIYATSNRRHLMPRDMMENERSTAINPSEAVEE
ncbi:MAG: ATP-binding protein, partial [Hyphomicrobiales bacterium]